MKSKEKIVLVGGGGHCRSVIDVIECEGRFEIVGIVDQQERIGQSVLGYKIITEDAALGELAHQYKNFLITVGHIKSNSTRVRLFKEIKNLGGLFPPIFSPLAYVSKHAKVEEGTIIMHGAIINASASVGKNSIINTNALIEHDTSIGDHSHISTGVVINGECKIGSSVFMGSRSVVIQGCEIGSNTLVAAGAVIVKNIEGNGLYAGAPATLKNKLNNE